MVSSMEFEVYRCNDCELLFLNPMPSEELLISLYPKSYYSYTVDNKVKKSKFKQFLFSFLMLDPSDTNDIKQSDNKRILDFGCGSGWVLNKYKDKGYDTYGLDLDENAIAIGQKNGHKMSNQKLIETNYPDNNFDNIRSNHSLEHIINIKETIREFNRILKTNGRLFIAVPNTSSITSNIFGKYWYYLGIPYHTYNYNYVNLKILLESNGFKIQKVIYRSDWQGILGSMQIFFNRKTNKSSEGGKLINPIFKIFVISISKIFDFFRKGDSIEVYAIKE